MKDEILAGLRNALARNQTLEEAIASFVNAGYNQGEVEQAARILQNPAMSIVYPSAKSSSPAPQSSMPKPAPDIIPQREPLPANLDFREPLASPPSLRQPLISQRPVQTAYPKKEGGVSKKLVIFLVVILVIVLGLLGATLLFKDKIAAALGY